jgi:methylthioribose-1-phosphate isomerase
LKVDGQHYRSIWLAADGVGIEIIDQTRLPFTFVVVRLDRLQEAMEAISCMQVRGAPLIGATAAYGMCLGLREGTSTAS